MLLWVIFTGAVSHILSSDCPLYTSGRFVCLEVSSKSSILERRGASLYLCVYCTLWPKEMAIPRWLHFRIGAKDKTRKPAELSHDKKTKNKTKISGSLNLNWTCARGVHECDIEMDIKEQTNKQKKNSLLFFDIQKCFYKWRRSFRKQPWESVSTSHRSCHAE